MKENMLTVCNNNNEVVIEFSFARRLVALSPAEIRNVISTLKDAGLGSDVLVRFRGAGKWVPVASLMGGRYHRESARPFSVLSHLK